eukprot:4890729-Amphidinium_carterae.1
MHIANCRLDAAAQEQLQALWDSPIYTQKVVKDLRSKSTDCPQPSTEARLSHLQKMGSNEQVSRDALSTLGKQLCRCRDELQQCVVGIVRNDEWQWYHIAVVYKSPM